MNTPRKITIEAVLNGFVCKVGCQTVIFCSVEDLIQELAEYLRTPELVEVRFRTSAINRALLLDVPQPVCESVECDKPMPPPAPLIRPKGRPIQGEANQCGSSGF